MYWWEIKNSGDIEDIDKSLARYQDVPCIQINGDFISLSQHSKKYRKISLPIEKFCNESIKKIILNILLYIINVNNIKNVRVVIYIYK